MDRSTLTRATTIELLVAVASIGAALASLHTALNLRRLRRPVAAPVTEHVSVLIPARDEAGNIGACLNAVMESQSLQSLEILYAEPHWTTHVSGSSQAGTCRYQRAGWESRGRARGLLPRPTVTSWCSSMQTSDCIRRASRRR
jgi:hypothetical protein